MIGAQLKSVVPRPLAARVERLRLRSLRRRFAGMNRAQAFSVVYRDQYWGLKRPFDSGSGSESSFAGPYCQAIGDYIAANTISSVVDLGCGDFRVGRELAKAVPQYCGVDIVADLVDYNVRHYASDRASFKCLDIVEDALPPGELCLVRQVLQHLSNAEILTVVDKLRIYQHVIITEHVPAGAVRFPNLDKPHGPDTRLPDGSGVFLALPPFCCEVSATWEFPCDGQTKLLTTLIRH